MFLSSLVSEFISKFAKYLSIVIKRVLVVLQNKPKIIWSYFHQTQSCMPIVALNHYSNVGFLEIKFLATSTIDIDFFKGSSFNKKETEPVRCLANVCLWSDHVLSHCGVYQTQLWHRQGILCIHTKGHLYGLFQTS